MFSKHLQTLDGSFKDILTRKISKYLKHFFFRNKIFKNIVGVSRVGTYIYINVIIFN